MKIFGLAQWARSLPVNSIIQTFVGRQTRVFATGFWLILLASTSTPLNGRARFLVATVRRTSSKSTSLAFLLLHCFVCFLFGFLEKFSHTSTHIRDTKSTCNYYDILHKLMDLNNRKHKRVWKMPTFNEKI